MYKKRTSFKINNNLRNSMSCYPVQKYACNYPSTYFLINCIYKVHGNVSLLNKLIHDNRNKLSFCCSKRKETHACVSLERKRNTAYVWLNFCTFYVDFFMFFPCSVLNWNKICAFRTFSSCKFEKQASLPKVNFIFSCTFLNV